MPVAVRHVVPKDPSFRSVVRTALSQRERAEALAGRAVRDGLESMFLVGCGGSLNDFGSTHFLLESRSSVPVFCVNSDEFTRRRPPLLGPRSLVLTASHNGNTPETLRAAEVAREAGAPVVAFTTDAGTPLAGLADEVFTYGSDRTVLAPKQVLISQLGYALLEAQGLPGEYARIRAAFDALPEALDLAHDEADPLLAEVAENIAAAPITYVVSGGPNYGVGYGMAMCYLMEMQRLNAASFHADEFFHGAFEIVDADSSVLLWLGEDPTRPQVARVSAFLDRYRPGAQRVDSTSFSLPGVPADLRGEVTPLVLSTLSKRLAEHLEAVTGNPLTRRRYMFTVEY